MVFLGRLLLGEEEFIEIWCDTTGGDGDLTDEFVQLLIVLDGELDVTGHDTGLLVFASAIAGQFEQLSYEILNDRRSEDGRTDTEARGVTSLAQKFRDTSDGERKTSFGRGAFAGLLDFLSDFTAARNFTTPDLEII